MRMGILALALLIAMSAVAAAADGPVVVVNSKAWHDTYLGSVYANHLDGKLIYFTSLGDAQIKTQTIRQNASVIVLESSRPVVKNYESVLRTNGFSNYEVIEFDTYRDLQLTLFDDEYAGVVVLDPRFGPEAIAVSPRIGRERFRPFFLDEETESDLSGVLSGEVVLAGRFPVRLTEGLEADTSYTGLSPDNANEITKDVAATIDEEWGVIMRVDRVDFVSLLQNLPVVVYAGSVPDTADVVSNISIDRYEIISADSANLGPQIEESVGRDLSFMLKYGRTITNLPGLTGRILDLDTMFVDYPSANLVIESIEHYEDANALLVTYANRGNVDTYFLTNVEYADNALTDPFLRVAPPQETIEVAYPLDVAGSAPDAFLNTRYGMSVPLSNTILSEQGTQLVREDVSSASSSNVTIGLRDVVYDDEKGVLAITVESQEPAVGRVDVPISDELTFTSGAAESFDGSHTFLIDTPYHRAATFDRVLNITLYAGESAPVYEQTFAATPTIREGGLLTGSVVAIASGALVVLLIALIIALVIYVKRRD